MMSSGVRGVAGGVAWKIELAAFNRVLAQIGSIGGGAFETSTLGALTADPT